MTDKANKKSIVVIIISIIVVALVTFGVLCLAHYFSTNSSVNDSEGDKNTAELSQKSSNEDNGDETNADSYDRKEKAEKDDANRAEYNRTEDGKISATVSISAAGLLGEKVLVSGMVSNVIEDDGICIYVFSNEVDSFSRAQDAVVNAKNTICSIDLDKEQFDIGEWEVVIKYESPQSEGESEVATFNVNNY